MSMSLKYQIGSNIYTYDCNLYVSKFVTNDDHLNGEILYRSEYIASFVKNLINFNNFIIFCTEGS